MTPKITCFKTGEFWRHEPYPLSANVLTEPSESCSNPRRRKHMRTRYALLVWVAVWTVYVALAL